MEWNAKHGTLWNWDSMLTCNNAKAAENRNKVQPTTDQLAIEKDQGINIRSVSSAPDGRGSDGSISDLGYDSSSWSTKSASLNSSSIGESKTPSFTLDGFEASPEDSTNKRELAKTEPLLSLKLGKQIYFEEICGGNSSKTMSSMMPLSPINSTGKRCKSSYQTTLVPCCQVEGCNLDLSSAKDYHRKHRVCVNHSKSPKVVIGGLERRFCQQCSRFHGLSEFDERKRSCRRRLSDHNARRRKPQPKAVCLNPGRLSSFAYDFNQPMSLLWDRVPPVDTNAGPAVTLTWDETSGSKYVQTKKYSIEPEMAGGNHGMNLPRDGIARAITMLNPDSSKLLPSKRIGAEVLNSGFEEYMIAPNEEDSLQDLHRALSLLSTDSSSWDAYETKRVSLDHGTSNHTSSFQRSIAPSPPHASSIHGFPLASEFWVDEQKASFQSRLHTPHDLCHRMG